MNALSVKTISAKLPCSLPCALAIRNAMLRFNIDGNTDAAFSVINILLSGHGVGVIRDKAGSVVCWYADIGGEYQNTILLTLNYKTGKWAWQVESWRRWLEKQWKQGRRCGVTPT